MEENEEEKKEETPETKRQRFLDRWKDIVD